jgi:SAM-dependent methyltransferase
MGAADGLLQVTPYDRIEPTDGRSYGTAEDQRQRDPASVRPETLLPAGSRLVPEPARGTVRFRTGDRVTLSQSVELDTADPLTAGLLAVRSGRLAAAAGEDGLVEFRPGEATRLPLRDDEWGTFDVAHARFVVEHVPHPVAVVRGMVRAVRPGGRIVLEDDGHDTFRLWPEPPGFGHLWRCYQRTYDRAGNDPLVGHRLVSLLHQAGAAPRRNTWLFFGACAGHPDLGAYVDNLVRVIDGVRGPILELGDVDAAYFDGCLAAIRRWGERPDAAVWYATSWAEGVTGTARA